MPLALGVLVSGNGSNLQAILDACTRGTLDARVSCVISNRTQAFALERASRAHVPAIAIPHQGFETREAFDRAVVAALATGAEWIGWPVDAVITPELLRAFRQHRQHYPAVAAFPGGAGAQAPHGLR